MPALTVCNENETAVGEELVEAEFIYSILQVVSVPEFVVTFIW
jgi:hypothetical protein